MIKLKTNSLSTLNSTKSYTTFILLLLIFTALFTGFIHVDQRELRIYNYSVIIFMEDKRDILSQDSIYVEDGEIDLLEEFESSVNENLKIDFDETNFIHNKNIIIANSLNNAGVNRTGELKDEELLEMNKKIAQLYLDYVLSQTKAPKNVVDYLTDQSDLNKIATALTEQVKFHIPASIKIAQSCIETGYGKRKNGNNYFGVKNKKSGGINITTTEYFSDSEVKNFKGTIISKTKVYKTGKNLYKCKVVDNFEKYSTPWESWRAHSLFLFQNDRYTPLFKGGKNYKEWAEKIGSVKHGGVGYATDPVYGKLIVSIIEKYNLDVLDY